MKKGFVLMLISILIILTSCGVTQKNNNTNDENDKLVTEKQENINVDKQNDNEKEEIQDHNQEKIESPNPPEVEGKRESEENKSAEKIESGIKTIPSGQEVE